MEMGRQFMVRSSRFAVRSWGRWGGFLGGLGVIGEYSFERYWQIVPYCLGQKVAWP
jgi:hypothetical protein